MPPDAPRLRAYGLAIRRPAVPRRRSEHRRMLTGETHSMPAHAEALCREAARDSGVTFEDLFRPVKWREIVNARWEAFKRLRDAGHSYPQIAGWFGVNHATVIYALRGGKNAR